MDTPICIGANMQFQTSMHRDLFLRLEFLLAVPRKCVRGYPVLADFYAIVKVRPLDCYAGRFPAF